MAHSLFRPDGERFVATELSRGPWSPDALHGGPVAALLARQLEQLPSDSAMFPARLSVELLRPVPLGVLDVEAEVLRPGRRVQVDRATLRSAEAPDTPLAWATLQRIRHGSVELPDGVGPGTGASGALPGPEDSLPTGASWEAGVIAYHSHATEHRAARGAWEALGPIADWIRLTVPVLEGEAPSPLQRVAAAADFGNGISSPLPFEEYLFINPDLTVALHRLPVGEWICLDAETWAESNGVGLAESELSDEQGRIGRSLQSLLIDRAPPV